MPSRRCQVPATPPIPSVWPVPGTTGMMRTSEPVLREDLDPVVGAIADVDQPVVAADDAVRMAAVARGEQAR